jgi:hypothetical protein
VTINKLPSKSRVIFCSSSFLTSKINLEVCCCSLFVASLIITTVFGIGFWAYILLALSEWINSSVFYEKSKNYVIPV